MSALFGLVFALAAISAEQLEAAEQIACDQQHQYVLCTTMEATRFTASGERAETVIDAAMSSCSPLEPGMLEAFRSAARLRGGGDAAIEDIWYSFLLPETRRVAREAAAEAVIEARLPASERRH